MPYAATKERLAVTRERNLIKSFLKKKRRLFNFLDDENVVNNNLTAYYFNKFYDQDCNEKRKKTKRGELTTSRYTRYTFIDTALLPDITLL
jgi:hypothetical protein